MNKEKLIKLLKKYNFDKEDYIILSGAAMVLRNLKDTTNDIDIAVSDELYNELLDNYNCTFELNVDDYDVWYIDNIINFSNHFYNDVEYDYYNGYRVQTKESIEVLKNKMDIVKGKENNLRY